MDSVTTMRSAMTPMRSAMTPILSAMLSMRSAILPMSRDSKSTVLEVVFTEVTVTFSVLSMRLFVTLVMPTTISSQNAWEGELTRTMSALARVVFLAVIISGLLARR